MKCPTLVVSAKQAPGPSLLRSIDECHQYLQQLFAWQQQALLLGQVNTAENLFQAYLVLHDCHKQFEDQQLIPHFETQPGQWSGKVYSAEHQKISALINKTKTSYAKLSNDSGLLDMNLEKNRLAIIALLDQQRVLKNVCEHHEMRETEDLLPVLDQRLTSNEVTELTHALQQQWNQVFKSQQSVIMAAAKVLSLDYTDMECTFSSA